MSQLLRSVMAEVADAAAAGRRPAPFDGCARGAFGGAMAVATSPVASRPSGARSPSAPTRVLLMGGRIDAVLPLVLESPVVPIGRRIGLPHRIEARRRAA